MDQNPNLLNYFENVLGIKRILFTSDETSVEAKTMIFIENFKTYTPVELELTRKILAAVNLDLSAVTVVDDADFENNSKITFKDEPVESREIFSPRALCIKPELKKLAWEKLKLLGQ